MTIEYIVNNIGFLILMINYIMFHINLTAAKVNGYIVIKPYKYVVFSSIGFIY